MHVMMWSFSKQTANCIIMNEHKCVAVDFNAELQVATERELFESYEHQMQITCIASHLVKKSVKGKPVNDSLTATKVI